MRFVDGNLKYDTDKSNVIYSDGDDVLLQTKNGRVFIVNMLINRLMTANQREIKIWIGKRNADVYESLFGEVEEA